MTDDSFCTAGGGAVSSANEVLCLQMGAAAAGDEFFIKGDEVYYKKGMRLFIKMYIN